MHKIARLIVLCLPYFGCLADDKPPIYLSMLSKSVNMRSGPGKQYPIIWHYNILRLPVLVLACFNDWVKIRDYGKTEGWVHKSLLGKKKTAITVLKISMMHKSPNADSVLIAKLEQNVICEVVSTKDNWVKISVSGLKGWVAAYSLWGYRSD